MKAHLQRNWLIRKRHLFAENQILIHEAVFGHIKWGCASKSNIDIM